MAVIKAIQDGKLRNTEFERIKWFQLSFPKHCEGLNLELDPRKSWDSLVNKKDYNKIFFFLNLSFINNIYKTGKL